MEQHQRLGHPGGPAAGGLGEPGRLKPALSFAPSSNTGAFMGILTGKRALIVGVATDRSIAWGIAQAFHEHGAELAFTYGNEKLKDRVEPLAASVGSKIVLPLDVTVDSQTDAVFQALGKEWGSLDILVHAVAFAPREALAGDFVWGAWLETLGI